MQVIGSYDRAVSVEEFRRARHRAPDTDDAYSAVLDAAEGVVTKATGRPLTPREMAFVVPVTGWRRWWVPVAPVNSLVLIETMDAGGNWVSADTTAARIVRGFDEPQLVLPDRWSGWATGTELLRVVLNVGYQGGALPELKQAIILLAAEYADAQVAVDEVEVQTLSFGSLRLIKQARYVRPCIFGGV